MVGNFSLKYLWYVIDNVYLSGSHTSRHFEIIPSRIESNLIKYSMNVHMGQFVLVPGLLNLKDKDLQYLDTLVYASLRSFNNAANGDCFPTHETIAGRAGLSKRFVINSIRRLETAGLVKVERSTKVKVSNQYYFDLPGTQLSMARIPFELFYILNLTPYEKAMLICIRQFFEHGFLKCMYNVKKLANYLGLTYRIVSKQYHQLVAKHYITELRVNFKCKAKGYNVLRLHNMFECGYLSSNVYSTRKLA
jgi:DNA-binding MarR family transcriptional regulator